MSKISRIVIIIFIVLIGAAVMAAILAVILFPGEKIKTMMEEKAAEALGMPVSVGGIGLTFAGIPAIKASDITIGEYRKGEPSLFSVTSVKVRVNLFSLLKKRVEIVSLELDSPEITVVTREDGSSNLPLPEKPPQKDLEAAVPPAIPLPISLNTLKIRDAKIVMDNREPPGSLISLDKINVVLNLDVSGDLKKFTSTGKTTIKEITLALSQEEKPIKGISAIFIHELSGDLTSGNLTLSKGELSVNDIPVTITGKTEGWTKTSFTAGVKKLGITNALDALPEGLLPEQDKIDAKGTLSLHIESTVDIEPEEPVIAYNGRLDIEKVRLSYDGLPQSVDEVTVHITFSEKDIHIKNASIRIGGSNFSLSGTVANYVVEPAVSLKSEGDINLGDVTDAFPLPEGMDASGGIDFNLKMNGMPSDLKTFAAEGEVHINRISAVFPETFKNPAVINGVINLTPAAVNIENIELKSGKSDIGFSGRINNYMTLAGLGENPAVFTARARSDVLDLNDLLIMKEKKDPESAKPWDLEETLTALPIPPNLSAEIGITLGTVVFGRMKTDTVRGRVTLADGVLELSGLNISAYRGTLTGSTSVNFADPEKVTYSGDFDLKAFDSAQFIADFFGVGDIVRGKFSSSFHFTGAGLDSVSMVENLRASGNMTFDNGQIVNLDFTRKLGNHLKFLDFDTLDFDRIYNTFRVENQKLFTPDIVMKTVYGDITVDGVTGFDKTLDYTITLNLNKKTSELALKNLSSLTQYLAEKPERIELNIIAAGTLKSPSFTLDTTAAEQKLKESLKKEVDKLLDKQEDELKKKGKELLKRLFR